MQRTYEKTLNRFIAIILIMVLTLADLVTIGLNFASLAIDMVATNNSNVEFEAYFKDKKGEKVTITEEDLNAEKINMYVEISVLREGYFNGKISLEDSNLQIVDVTQNPFVNSIEGNTINLNQINSGKNVILEIQVKSKTQSTMNVNILDKATIVKIEGSYVYSKGTDKVEGTTIVTAKLVSPENISALSDATILSNKIYNIDGVNKRVLQILVRSQIKDNTYPVKESKINLTLPTEAESVEVIARTTGATNKNITFGDDNYSYNKESSTLQIKLENNEDENGNISCEQNAKDEFVVTCIYAENKKFKDDETNSDTSKKEETQKENTVNDENTKSEEKAIKESEIKVSQGITTYDNKNLKSETTVNIEKETDGIINYEISAEENEFYKGKIYSGEERIYNINIRSYVNTTKIEKNIAFTLDKTNYIAGENKKTSKITYKEISIKKDNFTKVLGEQGFITIKDENGTVFANITKETKADQNGNIIISIPQNTYKINIETSKVQSVGKIDFKVAKAIVEKEYTQDEIKSFTGIENKIIIETNEIIKIIDLKETTTEAKFEINTNTLKPGENENVQMKLTLLSNDESKDLYKNPTLKIVFPESATEVTAKYKMLYGNGLEKNTAIVKDEEGKKVLEINLAGEQTTYPGQIIEGTDIIVNANITMSKLITNKEVTISLEYTNEKANSYAIENKQISEEKTAKVKAEDLTLKEITKIASTNAVTSDISANSGIITKTITMAQEEENAEENNIEELEVALTAKVGGKTLKNNDEVHQGEVIEYNVSLKNNGTKDIENLSVSGLVPEGTSLYVTQDYTLDEKQSEEKKKDFTNITVKQGKTINLSYQVKVDNKLTPESKIENEIYTSYNNNKIKFTNYVKKSDIILELKTFGRDDKGYIKGGFVYQYIAQITNNTDEDIKNVKIQFENNEIIQINRDYNYDLLEDNSIVIEEIHANKTYNKSIYFYVKNSYKDNQFTTLNIKSQYNNDTYYSNTIKEQIANYSLKAEISHTPNNTVIKSGDKIEYQISIENIGQYDVDNLIIKDKIFNKLEINSVTINEKDLFYTKSKDENEDYNLLEMDYHLNIGEKVTIVIKAQLATDESEKEVSIINKAQIYNNINHICDTNEDKCNIKLTKENNSSAEEEKGNDKEDTNNSNELNNDNDKNNTTNNEDSDKNLDNNSFKITGQVWKDEEKTGDKSDNNGRISEVAIYLLNSKTGEIAKDTKGKEITAKTNSNGEYTLENIPSGSYIVAFDYDKSKYAVTEYQKQGVNEANNSDAILNSISINGKTEKLAITDILEINSDLANIDLGLTELKTFDLELTKTISKVTVKNDKEVKSYDFNNTNLAKVEIDSKKINNSTVEIEYVIQVKNTGEIAGYAKSIVDYIPSELDFDSKVNSNWYKKDNYIYSNSLENEQIAPGEIKQIKLILTKQMTEDSTGLISNIAEIQESDNSLHIKDIDSTPSNRQKNEDDLSQADIIIGIKTGAIVKYTFAIIAVLVVTVLGIKQTKK